MNTLQITENAKKQIAKLLNNEPKVLFSVSVTGGGCSGFKYNFSIDSRSNIEDIMIGEVLIDK